MMDTSTTTPPAKTSPQHQPPKAAKTHPNQNAVLNQEMAELPEVAATSGIGLGVLANLALNGASMAGIIDENMVETGSFAIGTISGALALADEAGIVQLPPDADTLWAGVAAGSFGTGLINQLSDEIRVLMES